MRLRLLDLIVVFPVAEDLEEGGIGGQGRGGIHQTVIAKHLVVDNNLPTFVPGNAQLFKEHVL